ncbi:MAG TPA: ATP-binding protein [Gemmatimonadaceae bacterium]|nr:ATP-binding protein [Gemmatimonadaceae bacterium]
MSPECDCRERHLRRKIVLTGGPGAGKTAVLEMIRPSLCEHVVIVPESAGIIFKGGFPRGDTAGVRRATQRAIYHVQCELEEAMTAQGAEVMLCDRGAVDGFAYWPGPDDFWQTVGTTLEDVLRRYDAVIHLRVPDVEHGYGYENPLRTESAAEAKLIDDRILEAWAGHPRRVVIGPATDFIEKARQTLAVLRRELPGCCRDHATRAMNSVEEAGHV